VRGNCDRGAWAWRLPETATMQVGGVRIHVLHDLGRLDLEPGHGIRVVVSGHSHKPGVLERGGVLYVNPGSCGPRRFRLPVAVGELWVDGGEVAARTGELRVPSP
jgi:predicted phosphodiesterase